MQTTFGEEEGNCMSACVASLLELPIEEVPSFLSKERWELDLNIWLAPRNLFFLEIRWRPFPAPAKPLLCTASGKSPRGDFDHCIVGQIEMTEEGDKVQLIKLHDPHPDDTGLETLTHAGFFVPIDPSKGIR